jgi:hypothetical protein
MPKKLTYAAVVNRAGYALHDVSETGGGVIYMHRRDENRSISIDQGEWAFFNFTVNDADFLKAGKSPASLRTFLKSSAAKARRAA